MQRTLKRLAAISIITAAIGGVYEMLFWYLPIKGTIHGAGQWLIEVGKAHGLLAVAIVFITVLSWAATVLIKEGE